MLKWESFEDAKRRIEEKNMKSIAVEQALELDDQGYVTMCGGIQPFPILLPEDKEE